MSSFTIISKDLFITSIPQSSHVSSRINIFNQSDQLSTVPYPLALSLAIILLAPIEAVQNNNRIQINAYANLDSFLN